MKYRWVGFAAVALVLGGCSSDLAPEGLRGASNGTGAVVRFDLAHTPLPAIPLPNDLATWPDPSSRTGLRLNASVLGETSMERNARLQINKLEGWNTFGEITVSFDMPDKQPGRAALDLANIMKRHQGDDYDLKDDVAYIINLKTGVPVPIDLGEGTFPETIRDKHVYWRSDPRRSEEFLLLESFDEAPNRPASAPYDKKYDTDFDGIVDHPNLDVPGACPPPPSNLDASDESQVARDRCMADHMLTWYERQSDSLLLKPVIPLEEMTEYAVVLTDRLLDSKERVIRSPQGYVNHPMQQRAAERVKQILSDSSMSSYYGDMGGTGLKHVVYTWSFTTQPVYADMAALRNGLYGVGPFAHLGRDYPATMHLDRLAGMHSAEEQVTKSGTNDLSDPACQDKKGHPRVAMVKDVLDTVDDLIKAAGIGNQGNADDVIAPIGNNIAYFVSGEVNAPFLIRGGPGSGDRSAAFNIDFKTGETDAVANGVTFILSVPKTTDKFKPPFPVVVYGHGSGMTRFESLLFAGNLARHGFATIAIDAVGHGLEINPTKKKLFKGIFKGACMAPLVDSLVRGRATDLNEDQINDSGADLWTPYFFHTRDVVRQSVLDDVQVVRALRSFDGKRTGQDYNDDGQPDIAGDFNGDGVVDVGGPDNRYVAMGESFGGIMSIVLGAVDPYVTAIAPISGGGGLVDVGMRANQIQVVGNIALGLMGPVVLGRRIDLEGDQSVRTNCKQNQLSMRWIVPDRKHWAEIEFACVDMSKALPNGAGTVLIHNDKTGRTRCVRTDDKGRFRMGIPSSAGDGISVEFFAQPDAVDSYATCRVPREMPSTRVVDHWESGFVRDGDTNADGEVTCSNERGCQRFQRVSWNVGDHLVAPVEGYGLFRQSPDFRSMAGFGQVIMNGADPINFAPYYGLRPTYDPQGHQTHTTMFDTVAVGDPTVPISTGISAARAAGVVPFMAPDAAQSYPALADYATPRDLYAQLGNRTPNRVYIDGHVLEAVNRLARHPAGPGCQPNELPVSDQACHASCTEEGSPKGCRAEQVCIQGTCRKPDFNDWVCRTALFDVDDFDEGRLGYDEQSADVPLRLGRVAGSVVQGGDLSSAWRPRLLGTPKASTDDGAWDASAPINGVAAVYVKPWGVHCWNLPDHCRSFDTNGYMIHVVGRYFSTGGKDLYYLSHPHTHQCLVDASCPFMKP